MGEGYTKKCSKCNYVFHANTGVGFLFPKVYAETIEKAKSGELGPQLEVFFKEHEDGAIDASETILCCEQCGALRNEVDLTMYVPNKSMPRNNNGRWSLSFPFKGAEYVTPWDLKEYYTEYAKYPHKCEECGGNMRVVEENEELLCPTCKEPLEFLEMILWD